MYDSLLGDLQGRDPVRYAVSGAAGDFGRTLASHRRHPQLRLVAACDLDMHGLRQAMCANGYTDAELRACASAADVESADAAGQVALVSDHRALESANVDVLVEATGQPEASFEVAQGAIQRAAHVVMVSKETDSVAGPYLGQLARLNGVTYSPAIGDQPGNLIQLVAWARLLGLEVVAAGKASDRDYVYDPDQATIEVGQNVVPLADPRPFTGIGEDVKSVIAARREAAQVGPSTAVADRCEMGIVANVTGLEPASPELSFPLCRTTELADVFTPVEDGGILERPGVVDAFRCLRLRNEASFAGGVFVVVRCHNEGAWKMLAQKGHAVSRNGRYACVYWPYHLLGVETAMSVLRAHWHPEAMPVASPRTVLAARTAQDLTAGTTLEMDHRHEVAGVRALLLPNHEHHGGSRPVPLYLAATQRLARDVPAGTVLTDEMVELPRDSGLWRAWRDTPHAPSERLTRARPELDQS